MNTFFTNGSKFMGQCVQILKIIIKGADMKIKQYLQIVTVCGVALLGASCASISESDCLAGNWTEIGYKDGVNGKSPAILADYAKTCGELGVRVNQQEYLRNYDTGLVSYCTYDKGFSRGEGGSGYNDVCPDRLAGNFRAGYEDGRAEYEVKKAYDNFLGRIDSTKDSLEDVRDRLKNEEMSGEERARLEKKRRRLSKELDELRWDFRRFKRENGFDI